MELIIKGYRRGMPKRTAETFGRFNNSERLDCCKHLNYLNTHYGNQYKFYVVDDPVTTICYGQTRNWDSREEAEIFFLEGMECSEGAERERYCNIYSALKHGLTLCVDVEGRTV